MFEPHSPNFENVYNKMLKWFFDYLKWFQIFNDQCGSVPSIPVAVLGLPNPKSSEFQMKKGFIGRP